MLSISPRFFFIYLTISFLFFTYFSLTRCLYNLVSNHPCYNWYISMPAGFRQHNQTKTTGPFSQKPRKLFWPAKPFSVNRYLPLKLPAWKELLFMLRICTWNSSEVIRFEVLLLLFGTKTFTELRETGPRPSPRVTARRNRGLVSTTTTKHFKQWVQGFFCSLIVGHVQQRIFRFYEKNSCQRIKKQKCSLNIKIIIKYLFIKIKFQCPHLVKIRRSTN